MVNNRRKLHEEALRRNKQEELRAARQKGINIIERTKRERAANITRLKEENIRQANRAALNKKIKDEEEKRRLIARQKSISNIERQAHIDALNLKITEKQREARLKKLSGSKSLKRIILGKPSKHKSGKHHPSW